MEPLVQVFGLPAVLIGALCCFAGYRAIKVVLGIVGFFAGAILTAGVAFVWLHLQEAATLVVALVGGIVGAILASFLYFVGVFLLGAGFGASLGFVIGNVWAVEPLIPVAIFGVAGGVLAVIVQKLVIILSTAGIGAWGMVGGMASILGFFPPQLMLTNPWATWSVLRAHDWLLVLWVLLFAAGVIVQYRSAPEKKKQEETKED